LPDPAPRTVAEIVAAGTDYLAGRNVEHPALVCELLMSTLVGCKRLELPLNHNDVLSDKKLDAMRRGIKRTGAGEPVQYVLGSTGFMGHIFKVDRRALIPRPETEVLVEQVLQCEELWQDRPAVVDVGTGCGCIVISLAIARPDALYVGLDINAEAIELARENAVSLSVADRTYIPTAEYEGLPVHIREHEPRSALDGGPTGLSMIETVVQDAAIILKSGGRIFLEIGENQARAVTSQLTESGFNDIHVTKDLANRDRVIQARLAQ
jgi:release factor glutamine methyltransferase